METHVCDDINVIKHLKTAKEYVCEECIKIRWRMGAFENYAKPVALLYVAMILRKST